MSPRLLLPWAGLAWSGVFSSTVCPHYTWIISTSIGYLAISPETTVALPTPKKVVSKLAEMTGRQPSLDVAVE